MASPLADLVLQLAAGIPIGQGACRIPIEEAASMSEKQLGLLAERIQRKPADFADDSPALDARALHRQWARDNKIPDWEEQRLWAEKEKTLTNGVYVIPAG